jgi:hypothetical protein
MNDGGNVGSAGSAGTASAGGSPGSAGAVSAGGNPGSAGAVSSGGNAGSAASVSAGSPGAGESSLGECNKADCGPQLGLPNWTCADGSVGGPTGRCLRRPDGNCGWEINNCPMAGVGGAASQGGQGNAAGGSAAGSAGAEDCGGCSAGTVCVFQAGGPGPGHFVCAMQNPCGAAAACACIVAQGTCQPNLSGDPPRYCACDNGQD